MKKTLTFSIIFLCLVTACGYLFPTKIGDILQNPRQYADKDVIVSGRVTEVLSLIAFKYFVVKDDSGEITVITSRPLPAVGQKLKVRGTVKEAFSIGTHTLVIIREREEPPQTR